MPISPISRPGLPFSFQAEDGIRDLTVTGVQTCALPILQSRGWRIRHSREVADNLENYQTHIQRSRGEFSCAKPSYIKLQTAWVSDRTVCYLASGKPVVVQDTGPSAILPNGEGMFRFTTLAQAAEAIETINADYEHHCRAARKLAETHFDAKLTMRKILDCALDVRSRRREEAEG